MADQTVVPTLTVTIGRNIDDTPMSDPQWSAYVSTVRTIVTSVANEVWTDGSYVGEWDGATEDAHIFHGTAGPVDLDALADRLSVVAWEYRQDGIGLALGLSRIVYAVSRTLDRSVTA